MPCQVTINNIELKFQPKSLTGRVARKLITALNHAYMRSISIACAPYVPPEQTDRARYTTACQLVHDNVYDLTEAQSIRNMCIEKLQA